MPTIRRECYDRIKEYMRQTIFEYYNKHKDRFGDERSRDSMEATALGLDEIFTILDDYDIRRRVIKDERSTTNTRGC